MYSVINSPENARILEALANRARAEAWHHNMRTGAYAAAGLGALFICGAVALVIYDNGTAFAAHVMANAGTSFGRAFLHEVGSVPLHGIVKMDPGKVTVQQDAPLQVTGDVAVHQDKPFAIAQDKPLQVAGEITANMPRPTGAQMAPTSRPASNAKAVTNYTIFKTVDFPPGQVVTGWRFDDSTQETPSHQYCYYNRTIEENADAAIYIGYDGNFKQPRHVPNGVNITTAFQNCVWYQ